MEDFLAVRHVATRGSGSDSREEKPAGKDVPPQTIAQEQRTAPFFRRSAARWKRSCRKRQGKRESALEGALARFEVLLEQLEDQLAALVGDRQGLNAELLLGLPDGFQPYRRWIRTRWREPEQGPPPPRLPRLSASCRGRDEMVGVVCGRKGACRCARPCGPRRVALPNTDAHDMLRGPPANCANRVCAAARRPDFRW